MERQKELDYCLQQNSAHPLIDNILIFYEGKVPELPKNCKVVGDFRPTYHDLFQLTSQYPHDINIVANSDIMFNDTLEKANRIRDRECFAITRHEYRDGKVLPFDSGKNAPAKFSQDVWIFRGFADVRDCHEVLAQDLKTQDFDKIKFWLGIPGCDNVVAKRLFQSGYSVKNPYNDIQCLHVHSTSDRPEYSHRCTGIAQTWSGLQAVPPVKL